MLRNISFFLGSNCFANIRKNYFDFISFLKSSQHCFGKLALNRVTDFYAVGQKQMFARIFSGITKYFVRLFLLNNI
ncbi:MAG: hypothetical protein COS14_14025 [Bacteroidetes bacterium CG02_land_8_20_14_3_00_31_25]|nr:MAG: hypothetical protein COS14_14025 [Bacteroidetes bacterium CG02_land_8_20_14_3_00_31_25]PIY03196.1 MAG: hypothetical protein COZ21_10215 [Bacteroidetes bacterium CG_4_10_14_3_um_filter_31_20]